VLRLNASNHDHISKEGKNIEDVDNFTYLGAKLTNTRIQKKITRHV